MQLAADQEIDTLRAARRKVVTNIVVPCFLISVMAYIDRNNLSYAKLTMLTDLQFSESVYGFGAGIFFWDTCCSKCLELLWPSAQVPNCGWHAS